jgi:hypothetical protein
VAQPGAAEFNGGRRDAPPEWPDRWCDSKFDPSARRSAKQIIDQDAFDRGHRLAGDPVAAYLVRAELLAGSR